MSLGNDIFLQLEKENDERNNKNIRQSMTIIRKKVVTLQAGI